MKYSIEGDPLSAVICDLGAGESMVCEAGGMSWMSPNMQMETGTGGGLGKMIGRAMQKESVFLNRYTAVGGPGMIAFSSSFPGAIKAMQVGPGNEVIAQKSAFLAATAGVELSTYLQRRLGAGMFGGEGFIMQRLSGNGLVFLELDGYVKEYGLAAGQRLVVATGYLAAMTGGCAMEIQAVPGLGNKIFGGEGLFNSVVSGPGKVWVQSMPAIKMAQCLAPYFPGSGGSH